MYTFVGIPSSLIEKIWGPASPVIRYNPAKDWWFRLRCLILVFVLPLVSLFQLLLVTRRKLWCFVILDVFSIPRYIIPKECFDGWNSYDAILSASHGELNRRMVINSRLDTFLCFFFSQDFLFGHKQKSSIVQHLISCKHLQTEYRKIGYHCRWV